MTQDIKIIRKMVIEAVGELKPGQVYNIYQCGHIFIHSEDPLRLRTKRLDSGRHRCCAICGSLFEIKFKLCVCGREYLGKRAKESKSCRKCPKNPKPSKDNGNMNCRVYRNGHLADPERWDCALRDQCIDRYQLYDALPCRGCESYVMAGIYIEDYVMTTRRCA